MCPEDTRISVTSSAVERDVEQLVWRRSGLTGRCKSDYIPEEADDMVSTDLWGKGGGGLEADDEDPAPVP